METREEKAVELFLAGCNCSQSLFAAFSDLYGFGEAEALKLSASFGGGMGRMREVCGAFSGMLMVAGMETCSGIKGDLESKKYNYEVVQELAEEFRKRNGGSIICRELLGLKSQENSAPEPEARTGEYYKKRPCLKVIETAARILNERFFGEIGAESGAAPVFEPVRTVEQVKEMTALADQIWHQHFSSILSMDQIDYMVEKFQSVKAVADQLANQNYQYFMLKLAGTLIGFTGIVEQPEEKKLFLSKLYLEKSFRGKGYASRAFEFLEKICREKGYTMIWLTVNRFNSDTIAVYEKKGFVKARTQVSDIGNGYVMDDYIMEKEIR